MAEIATMTERMVAKAKGYDGGTIPGDYATLAAPCPTIVLIRFIEPSPYTLTSPTW